jgi:YtkA-like
MRAQWGGGRAARFAAGGAVFVLVSVGAGAAAGRYGPTALAMLHPSRAPAVIAAPVAPQPFAKRRSVRGYALELHVAPNRPTASARATLVLTRGGRPVNGARVRLTYRMLDMPMPDVVRALPQTSPGRYADAGPVLGMSGRWGLRVDVAPPRAAPFSIRLLDRMRS